MSPERDVTYETPDERLQAARAKYEEVMTYPGPEPTKPYYEAGVVGFVFGEMWSRPGLNRRDRRWITLTCVGAMGATIPIQTHFFSALNSGDCTIEELEEFTLFFGTQCGWPRAQVVDQFVIEAAQRVGVERRGFEPWADPASPTDRHERGRDAYADIMCAPPPESDTVFRRLGYLDYLYGEIWTRPVLTRRERRIIALCCAAIVEAEVEAQAFAALKSGDLTFEELQELVLHYAVYCGWQGDCEEARQHAPLAPRRPRCPSPGWPGRSDVGRGPRRIRAGVRRQRLEGGGVACRGSAARW
jgi:4-carboxymuconolactone decarboxylase